MTRTKRVGKKRAGKKCESLAGKLLLSTALIVGSLGYGWWQRHRPGTAAPISGQPAANAAARGRSAPASPPPLSALAELPMYRPPPSQTPLPLVTGTPAAGAAPPIPPGTHLQDGDYLSDMQQYEWGDLTVKISVRGGRITGVQVVQYPDHRPESLDLSRMASPILDSEAIKTQGAKVDVVSSATDTSYVYRDAIASAIRKATRP